MIKCRIYDIINLELYVNDLNNCDIFNRESVTIQCIDRKNIVVVSFFQFKTVLYTHILNTYLFKLIEIIQA